MCFLIIDLTVKISHFNTALPLSAVFQHPFVSQPLSRTLAIELLDKSNNPDHSTFNDFDDDDPEPEVTFDLLRFLLSVSSSLQTGQQSTDYVSAGSFPSSSNRALLSPSTSGTCDSSFCSLSFPSSLFPFLSLPPLCSLLLFVFSFHSSSLFFFLFSSSL